MSMRITASCPKCHRVIATRGSAAARHMRFHAEQEEWDEATFEVLNEEIVTHRANRVSAHRFSVEMRVIGRCKVGDQDFHWNKVICIPLQRIDEETED